LLLNRFHGLIGRVGAERQTKYNSGWTGSLRVVDELRDSDRNVLHVRSVLALENASHDLKNLARQLGDLAVGVVALGIGRCFDVIVELCGIRSGLDQDDVGSDR
jgi:hypothetical protein